MNNSKRYCMNCEKIIEFKLNKNVGHSECICCSGRVAMGNYNKIYRRLQKQHGILIKEANKLTDDADKWFKKQVKQLGKIRKEKDSHNASYMKVKE